MSENRYLFSLLSFIRHWLSLECESKKWPATCYSIQNIHKPFTKIQVHYVLCIYASKCKRFGGKILSIRQWVNFPRDWVNLSEFDNFNTEIRNNMQCDWLKSGYALTVEHRSSPFLGFEMFDSRFVSSVTKNRFDWTVPYFIAAHFTLFATNRSSRLISK